MVERQTKSQRLEGIAAPKRRIGKAVLLSAAVPVLAVGIAAAGVIWWDETQTDSSGGTMQTAAVAPATSASTSPGTLASSPAGIAAGTARSGEAGTSGKVQRTAKTAAVTPDVARSGTFDKEASMPDPDRFAASAVVLTGEMRGGLREPDATASGGASAETIQPAGMDELRAALAESAEAVTSETIGTGVDPATTASTGGPFIAAEDADVVVAETEAEILALERQVAAAQTDVADPSFAVEEQSRAGDMLTARITEYVNFRKGPSNDSDVIRVVATDTVIRAEPVSGCPHFCEVVIDGQSGYIYKSFIAYDQ